MARHGSTDLEALGRAAIGKLEPTDNPLNSIVLVRKLCFTYS
jgi:hypothetical protein